MSTSVSLWGYILSLLLLTSSWKICYFLFSPPIDGHLFSSSRIKHYNIALWDGEVVVYTETSYTTHGEFYCDWIFYEIANLARLVWNFQCKQCLLFFTNWYRRRFIFAKIMHLWKSEPNIMSWNCLPFNHLIPNTHNYALPRFCKQKICFLSNKCECLPIHMSMMYYIRLSNIDRNESVSCFTFWPQLSFYKDRHAFTVSWQKCCRFSILMLHLKWNLNWKCRECHMLT